jgi:hypothetical protein
VSVQQPDPGLTEVQRQDKTLAIIEAITGASREQILEVFADYPGKLRDFKDEVLEGGTLWLRLRRHSRRG